MYCTIFSLLLTTTAFTLYGQKPINYKDENDRKQGKWIYYGKDRPETGIPTDAKVEEGRYVNDRKEGIWIKYYKDGKTPKTIAHYENNRPNGSYQSFYDSGFLKEKGTFSKNRNTDSLTRCYDNGELKYLGFYNQNGREQGQITFFYKDGNIEWSYFATDGLQSNIIHLTESGDTIPGTFEWGCSYENKVLEKTAIKSDSLKVNQSKKPPLIGIFPPKTSGVPWNPNGYNKVYNSDGEIWLEGQFKDGELSDGKAYFYDRDGILLKVEVYRSGFYFTDANL